MGNCINEKVINLLRQVMAARVGKYHSSQLVLETLKQAFLKASPKSSTVIREQNLWPKLVLTVLQKKALKFLSVIKELPGRMAILNLFSAGLRMSLVTLKDLQPQES
jgi:hypothetical protein